MWRQRILKLSVDVTFSDPVTPHDLTEAERSLGGPLPEALAELLSETDGVSGEYGLGLIWPPARIVGDAGNGDQFAFLWTPRPDQICVWNHENDSRNWVAGSLGQYLQRWLDGTLKP